MCNETLRDESCDRTTKVDRNSSHAPKFHRRACFGQATGSPKICYDGLVRSWIGRKHVENMQGPISWKRCF